MTRHVSIPVRMHVRHPRLLRALAWLAMLTGWRAPLDRASRRWVAFSVHPREARVEPVVEPVEAARG